jgi:hypothetical protein
MSEIERLELAHPGEEFVYRWNQDVYTAPTPAHLSVGAILEILDAGMVPGTPVGMTFRKAAALFTRWSAHHDLPSLDSARRLIYLVDRYRNAIEADLPHYYPGQDLGQLWRTRHWRYLLNLIDHLPRTTWYGDALANDEEYAAMVAKSIESSGDTSEAPTGPPIVLWTQESALLATVADAVRSVSHTVAMANGYKGPGPKPEPRPVTALERARKAGEYGRRKKKHLELAARMLPHKYPSEG